MPRAEAGTSKWLSNKMKAKGLQKLRLYCPMCRKQCRDENGYKCHISSESHQRQLLLFADNSHRYIGDFSYEFEKCFLQLLKQQFGTKRSPANLVYQEYIKDRHHIHMNATRWTTLSGFVSYLGRTGKVVADKTEKGWFISYIDRDPVTIARQEALAKRQKMDKDDEERLLSYIVKQIERCKGEDQNDENEKYTEFKKDTEEKIQINLASKLKKKYEISLKSNICENHTASNSAEQKSYNFTAPLKEFKKEVIAAKRKHSALDEIIEELETSKEIQNRKDYWLAENLVVKVITQSLGDKYYKKKGCIRKVIDRYCAMVTMFDSGDTLKLDQSHLETVVPAEGRRVLVVNGAYRECHAIVNSLDEKNFCVSLTIDSGPFKGRIVNGIQYEDVCKIISV